jgi:hypothetical protein
VSPGRMTTTSPPRGRCSTREFAAVLRRPASTHWR